MDAFCPIFERSDSIFLLEGCFFIQAISIFLNQFLKELFSFPS